MAAGPLLPTLKLALCTQSSTSRSNGSPSLGLDSLTHLPNEGLVRDGSWATATNPAAGIVHSGRYFHLLT
ncbi:hypothetical protein J6590_023716 [Homalodisca vitripennis]|nr:hypothetical protein J6590_023716 [Homalodisca vitripennis]